MSLTFSSMQPASDYDDLVSQKLEKVFAFSCHFSANVPTESLSLKVPENIEYVVLDQDL